jgi:DNA polymerase-4
MTHPDLTPRILQVDADAFYVQVARLRDPEGAGRAELLLVGGSPQGRGVVTSASYAARKHGARSGMPTAQALRLCPDATVVGVPRRACSDTSRAIVAVLEQFTPVVEPASIDEMYLDLTGTEGLYRGETLEDTARRIRRTVLQQTEIAVSIGGGTTRLVAKLAAKRAKPHRTEAGGVVVVPPGGEAAFLQGFDLADIPGVGPRFQDRLGALGLVAVRDALRHDLATLQRWLGERAGQWLHRRIRGIDSTPVEHRARAKSISRDETFARDLDRNQDLTRELLRLADRATTRQKSLTLKQPVISDRVVASVAKALLERLRKARRVPARLLGVSLASLCLQDEVDQLSLFEEVEGPETVRDRALARAIDQVREKFGHDAVGRGA